MQRPRYPADSRKRVCGPRPIHSLLAFLAPGQGARWCPQQRPKQANFLLCSPPPVPHCRRSTLSRSFHLAKINAPRQSAFMILRIAGFLAAAILLTACASLPPPQTVPSVDLARYAGSWHEIESFPNWFQGGCAKTKAEYSPLPGGRIRVVNTCERGGRPTRIEGTARVVPGSKNSKLKVCFFWPFEGD